MGVPSLYPRTLQTQGGDVHAFVGTMRRESPDAAQPHQSAAADCPVWAISGP